MNGLEYKKLLETLEETSPKVNKRNSSMILRNEGINEEEKTKVSYIISPIKDEVFIDEKMYININKMDQVRIDDLYKVFSSGELRFINKILRLVSENDEELYVFKIDNEKYVKLLKIKPRTSQKFEEKVTDYLYSEKNYSENFKKVGERRIKFSNEYILYPALLDALEKMKLGIYEVEYDISVDLREILEGEIPIGFKRIKRVFP